MAWLDISDIPNSIYSSTFCHGIFSLIILAFAGNINSWLCCVATTDLFLCRIRPVSAISVCETEGNKNTKIVLC